MRTAVRLRRSPARPTPAPARLGLREALAATLPLWLASRVAVAVLSVAGAWALGARDARDVPGFRELWDRWDVGLFVKVARDGYLSPLYEERTEVDLPALPLALRAVHVVVRDWVVAGLLVSLVAGAVAAAALWRLATDEPVARGAAGPAGHTAGDPAAGRRAVLALVLFPYAVFLFAGYSEGLFLAFVTTSWLAATRRRWALAAVLAAGATTTRVLGVAFLAALVVHYLLTERRVRPSAAWLVLPVLSLGAHLTYLRVRTGHWDAYQRAMSDYWGRETAWPWEGLRATWRAATDLSQGSAYVWFWRAEIVAVLVGVVLAVALLRSRRWGEATYVAGCTLLMASSSYWASGVRAVLVWFPLYLLIGRHERVMAPYVWVCAPLMAVFVVAFTQGSWVD